MDIQFNAFCFSFADKIEDLKNSKPKKL